MNRNCAIVRPIVRSTSVMVMGLWSAVIRTILMDFLPSSSRGTGADTEVLVHRVGVGRRDKTAVIEIDVAAAVAALVLVARGRTRRGGVVNDEAAAVQAPTPHRV
jgi:hypothetical protein